MSATIGLLLLSPCHALSVGSAPRVVAHLRTTPPRLLFNFGPPPPPSAPPPLPAATPATEVVRRDLYLYGALVSTVATVPAVDWNAIGGSDLLNGARLGYFIAVALGSVYLGGKRQDLGEASPITGKSAALAPLFASATLGGLYLLIKYTELNPGTLYQFFACLFALLATSDLLQPLLGLAVTGELGTPADEAFGEEREAEIMNAGAAPAFAVSLALVAAYAQGPVSTGGVLPLPAFAALNNCLGWGITLASLGVLALESFVAAAGLLLGLFFYDAFFVFKSDVMLVSEAGVRPTPLDAPALPARPCAPRRARRHPRAGRPSRRRSRPPPSSSSPPCERRATRATHSPSSGSATSSCPAHSSRSYARSTRTDSKAAARRPKATRPGCPTFTPGSARTRSAFAPPSSPTT